MDDGTLHTSNNSAVLRLDTDSKETINSGQLMSLKSSEHILFLGRSRVHRSLRMVTGREKRILLVCVNSGESTCGGLQVVVSLVSFPSCLNDNKLITGLCTASFKPS